MSDVYTGINSTKNAVGVVKRLRDRGDGTFAEVIDGSEINLQGVQSVAIGAASVQSSAVGATTNRFVLTATVNCWVAVGDNPTAAAHTAGSFYMPAGAMFPISAVAGSTKVAVIQDSASGYLSVMESI